MSFDRFVQSISLSDSLGYWQSKNLLNNVLFEYDTTPYINF